MKGENMRSILFASITGLSLFSSIVPAANASWLSQALRGPGIPASYLPPGAELFPSIPATYYQPGPLFTTPPNLEASYPAPRVQRPIPNISGTWYMNGNPCAPCQIIQWRKDGSADFVNEHGSRACGTVSGDHVWIPAWSDGRSRGLLGCIRGDRIVWPNGTFWCR